MSSYNLKKVLSDIIIKTFNDKNMTKFYIELIPEERKTFHGDYDVRTKAIRVFNLNRPNQFIIATSLHEIAHHCENYKYHDTGHTKRFYSIYKQLLETAIKTGYINKEELEKIEDTSDIKMLNKYFGKITAEYNKDCDGNKNNYIIKVYNCFKIKDTLKENHYKYIKEENCWVKELRPAKKEAEYLKSLDPNIKIKILNKNQLDINPLINCVISGDTFDIKDILYKNGYRFNKEKKVWIKKLYSKDLNTEKDFLYKLKSKNITVKISNKVLLSSKKIKKQKGD